MAAALRVMASLPGLLLQITYKNIPTDMK